MALFWGATLVLAAALALLLVYVLTRGHEPNGPSEAFDLTVYRDQLAEVDRDLARNVLSADDADRLRTEISRRILAADAKAQGHLAGKDQPIGLGAAAAAMIVTLMVGGSYWIYTQLGAPGYGDLGLATRIDLAEAARDNRPSQQEAETQVQAQTPARADSPAEDVALVQQLRGAISERPNDLRGHILLARSEASLGNYAAAYRAQERVLALKADTATGQDYADLADMMVSAAGGYVSPEAEQALEIALSRAPDNGVALYYMGLMMAQTGRPDVAFGIWDRLIRQSPSDAPWLPPILAQIEDMAFRAGIADYQVPRVPGLPGPSAADIDAAGEMSAAERDAMIRGMVAQLSDRLATEGGSPEDWARLISSLGVLGDEGQAIAIWNNAQEVFADNPEALSIVRDGARAAGLVL